MTMIECPEWGQRSREMAVTGLCARFHFYFYQTVRSCWMTIGFSKYDLILSENKKANLYCIAWANLTIGHRVLSISFSKKTTVKKLICPNMSIPRKRRKQRHKPAWFDWKASALSGVPPYLSVVHQFITGKLHYRLFENMDLSPGQVLQKVV